MRSGRGLAAALLLIGLPLAGTAAQPVAAQTVAPPAAQAEPEMPPLPSIEGQQGEVVSHGAVSTPSRKRRGDTPAAASQASVGKQASSKVESRTPAGRKTPGKSSDARQSTAKPSKAKSSSGKAGAASSATKPSPKAKSSTKAKPAAKAAPHRKR